jgi:hypothetical protein
MRKGSVSGRGGCSVGEGPIGLGGIEQRHPTLNALQGDGARLVQVRPTVKTDPPAADGRRGLVDLLRKAPAPIPPETIAATFDGRNIGKRRDRIESLLETLTTIGLARSGQLDGQTRYFIPR